MQELKIRDLILTPLKQIVDQRGAVFHYLRADDQNYHGFGEAYYSKINAGVVKGWKCHSEIYQHFCVPLGAVKIVVYDGREDSESFGCVDTVILNDSDSYARLTLPPKVWYSFKCVADGYSLLANIINQTHRPEESQTLNLDTELIPYEWE